MTTNFEQALFNIARGFASLATRLAKGFAPNAHLRNSISSKVERKGKGRFIIRVRARGPDARAREYGSGIHSRRSKTSKHQLGPRGKILIKPKKSGGALVFPWEKASANIPKLPDGRVVLKQVLHPGVMAANGGKGYLGPAMIETRKTMRKKALKEGATAIRADVRAAFGRT